MDRIWLPLCATLIAPVFGAGVWCGLTFPNDQPKGYVAPKELSDSERSQAVLYQETTPTVMTLRIVTKEEFYTTRAPNVWAVAQTYKVPCQIIVQAGAMIVAHPADAEAHWADRDDGDTLAHEILHCLRGGWHR